MSEGFPEYKPVFPPRVVVTEDQRPLGEDAVPALDLPLADGAPLGEIEITSANALEELRAAMEFVRDNRGVALAQHDEAKKKEPMTALQEELKKLGVNVAIIDGISTEAMRCNDFVLDVIWLNCDSVFMETGFYVQVREIKNKYGTYQFHASDSPDVAAEFFRQVIKTAWTVSGTSELQGVMDRLIEEFGL